jgi:hypothetical protein
MSLVTAISQEMLTNIITHTGSDGKKYTLSLTTLGSMINYNCIMKHHMNLYACQFWWWARFPCLQFVDVSTVIMPGRRRSSCQNEVPRVWPEGLVSHAETSCHAHFLHPPFLCEEAGNLSIKNLSHFLAVSGALNNTF